MYFISIYFNLVCNVRIAKKGNSDTYFSMVVVQLVQFGAFLLSYNHALQHGHLLLCALVYLLVCTEMTYKKIQNIAWEIKI